MKLNVSRETFDRLDHVEVLLRKWNPKINLVSRNSLGDVQTRHILDSAQLFALAETGTQSWVDLGSGGGFPGLVIAILAQELAPDMAVTLIESDQRKCTFLRTVVRETGLVAKIITDRIESVASQNADVVSARALADLTALLDFGKRHMKPNGICLFPKGASWQKELEQARATWSFDHEAIPSETDENSVILKVKDIRHE